MTGNVVLDELSSKWLAISVTAILVYATVLRRMVFPDSLAKIPTFELEQKELMTEKGWKTYSDGYKRFKDGIFCIKASQKSPILVAPPDFLPELQKLPDNSLSFIEFVNESMHGKYTGMHGKSPDLISCLRTFLNPSLRRLCPIISEEVREAMRSELPQSSEWTECKIGEKLLRIMAKTSGRVFIGHELCHDEAYISAATGYTTDLMAAVHLIEFMPAWLRPLVSRLLPRVRKLHSRTKDLRDILRPIVLARRKAAENPDYQSPADMLQWFIDSREKLGAIDDTELANIQLHTAHAALHTTTRTALNAVSYLAAYPALVDMLKEDVENALSETDGQFTDTALQNMKKLDSFLKEVTRYHSLSASAFHRKVLQPITLSNGQEIPAGVRLEVAAVGVNFDENIHEGPGMFDPLRYYKIRMAKKSGLADAKATNLAAHSEFTSVGKSSLTFGFGRHACPGRFFAISEIKLIMANLLLHFQVKTPSQAVGQYSNLETGLSEIYDPDRIVLMRRL